MIGNHVAKGSAPNIESLRRMILPTDVGFIFDPRTSGCYTDNTGSVAVAVNGQVACRADVRSGTQWLNDPCPEGFSLPTSNELSAMIAAESITDAPSAFSSRLKIASSGYKLSDVVG